MTHYGNKPPKAHLYHEAVAQVVAARVATTDLETMENRVSEGEVAPEIHMDRTMLASGRRRLSRAQRLGMYAQAWAGAE